MGESELEVALRQADDNWALYVRLRKDYERLDKTSREVDRTNVALCALLAWSEGYLSAAEVCAGLGQTEQQVDTFVRAAIDHILTSTGKVTRVTDRIFPDAEEDEADKTWEDWRREARERIVALTGVPGDAPSRPEVEARFAPLDLPRRVRTCLNLGGVVNVEQLRRLAETDGPVRLIGKVGWREVRAALKRLDATGGEEG